MRNYKIYTLNDPISGDVRYIGQTFRTLKTRLREHLRDKITNQHKMYWIIKLSKLNLTPKIVLIKENLNKEECNRLEIEYIKTYKEAGYKLINITNGGDGTTGYKFLSDRTGDKNSFYNKKHSEETKKFLSEIRGSLMTKENKEKLSKLAKERWSNIPEDIKMSNIINQKNRKDIGQYTLDGGFITKFISLRQIERDLGYFRANITPCLKGEFKQAYGYIWKYL